MVTAFVLLNADHGKVNEVADALAGMEGVAEVHSVAGRYDLIAILRVRRNEDLADLVTDQIRRLEGIESSETLIGFRVISRYDLERMFAVGLEEG
jgi:DNA-binding Lrp family transcriptional regulator